MNQNPEPTPLEDPVSIAGPNGDPPIDPRAEAETDVALLTGDAEEVVIPSYPEFVLPAVPIPAKPVSAGERSMALDVLRGFAVFGILFVNIESFSMISPARRNPDFGGGDGPINHAIWLLTMLLADTKFIALFSMMFGAGAVVMVKRWKQSDRNPIPLYYRRMTCLMLFGILHGFFIWDGDILFFYGAYGCLLFPFMRLRGDVLLIVGLTLIFLEGLRWGWPQLPQSTGRIVGIEYEALRGTFRDELKFRRVEMLYSITEVVKQFALQGIGFMCVGMGLLKGRVLTGHRGMRTYGFMAIVGFAVGIALTGMPSGWFKNFHGWDGPLFVFGSLIVSFGWMGAAILLAKMTPRFILTRAFANVGRMALTNYITHSVVCTTVFYGRGLGLFNQMERTGQIKLVLAICVSQLIISSIWMKFFRFGPLEWVWRCVTYLRFQPFLRRGAALATE